MSTWKELLRGALTPTMLAKRLRASEEFSGLLDWTGLEITDHDDDCGGTARENGGKRDTTTVYRNSNVACVDAALTFENNDEKTSERISVSPPEVYRFELAKMLGGVWLIDSVQQQRSTGLLQKQQQSPPPRPARKTIGSQKRRQSPRPQQQKGKPRRLRKQGKRKSDGDDDGDKTGKREAN